MSAIAKNKKKLKKIKIIIIIKKSAIDQNAFWFPGARPNMADTWIRNSVGKMTMIYKTT